MAGVDNRWCGIVERCVEARGKRGADLDPATGLNVAAGWKSAVGTWLANSGRVVVKRESPNFEGKPTACRWETRVRFDTSS